MVNSSLLLWRPKGGLVIKVLICFVLFCSFSGMATQITWLKTDWPPHQISSGQAKDKGTFDLLQQQVIALLPQIKHKTHWVNLARLEQAFAQKTETVCSFGAIYTKQRAISRWYSVAAAALPGLAVHFRHSANVEPYVVAGEHKSVDMLTLAKDNKLTGAYQPNRFYPASVLEATRYSSFMPAEFTTELNAATLLLSRRVDYVVEYPERMAFYLQQKQHKESIQSFAVADASAYVVSYVTCNKSPEAPMVIEQINTALRQLWQTVDYRQAMYSWVDEPMKAKLAQPFELTRQQVISGDIF